MKNTLKRFIKK